MAGSLTEAQYSEITRRYRLPMEELTDETKLRMRVISTKTIANLSIAAAQGSPVPGLPVFIFVMNAIFESFNRVQVYRARCEDIQRQVVNLVWLVERNQMRIKSDEVREMLVAFRRCADDLNKVVEQFSRFGRLRSWLSRHDLSGRLDKFEKSISEFCRDFTLAVAWNPVSELLEDLRIALSSIERDALQEKIYDIRMRPDIDVSNLPADLSLEVQCTNERPIAGSEYWIKQGKWLNRDVVALKLPKHFAVLGCSQYCGGSEDTCEKADRHVPAIKAMERFNRQVKIWRSLKHPNVLEFYGWCKIREQVHLVTRWLESGDVKHYCKVSKPSDTDILNIVRDIAIGLRYIHSKDVVHAALTPGNVLIRPDGTAAIGDFSRAKIVPADNTTMERTDMSEQVTLMRYQAPEEHQAPRPMSKQGDIYAWSMVSLEIISGVEPFPNAKASPSHLYERIFLHKTPPALEEHPSPLWEKYPGLWELINSCQNPERLARPSLDDILTKLDECGENDGTSS